MAGVKAGEGFRLDTTDNSHGHSLAPIVQALETQLGTLDRLGAHIAAAHIDAAINQLRRDQVVELQR